MGLVCLWVIRLEDEREGELGEGESLRGWALREGLRLFQA